MSSTPTRNRVLQASKIARLGELAPSPCIRCIESGSQCIVLRSAANQRCARCVRVARSCDVTRSQRTGDRPSEHAVARLRNSISEDERTVSEWNAQIRRRRRMLLRMEWQADHHQQSPPVVTAGSSAVHDGTAEYNSPPGLSDLPGFTADFDLNTSVEPTQSANWAGSQYFPAHMDTATDAGEMFNADLVPHSAESEDAFFTEHSLNFDALNLGADWPLEAMPQWSWEMEAADQSLRL